MLFLPDHGHTLKPEAWRRKGQILKGHKVSLCDVCEIFFKLKIINYPFIHLFSAAMVRVMSMASLQKSNCDSHLVQVELQPLRNGPLEAFNLQKVIRYCKKIKHVSK